MKTVLQFINPDGFEQKHHYNVNNMAAVELNKVRIMSNIYVGLKFISSVLLYWEAYRTRLGVVEGFEKRPLRTAANALLKYKIR